MRNIAEDQLKNSVFIEINPENMIATAKDMATKKICAYHEGSLARVHCFRKHPDYKATKKFYFELA